MRAVWNALSVLALAVLAASFAGGVHPLGDSLAVFRLPLALVAAFMVIWTGWSRWIRWGIPLIILAAGLAHVAPKYIHHGAPSDHDFTLYQQNLLFSRKNNSPWLSHIAQIRPDMITVQEVSGRNKAVLDALSDSHPTQHYCDFASVGGVAVLSRLPAVKGSAFCAARDGMAGVQLQTEFGPVWLVSLHLHWPYPYRQAQQVDRLLPVLAGLEGHVIIGGDFNAVGWSHTVKRIASAARAERVVHHDASFHLPKIRMPVTIDHVLTGKAYAQSAISMPKLGSDHHGVLAYLTRAAN